MAQTVNYDNVPVYSGMPPVEPETTGFFQPAPVAEGILATDQARAVAEVQAALVIAASRPRNELRARDRLLQACQREGLANGAIYQYKMGGGGVSGPSIRLAEAAARAWGNMTYGFRELSRNTGISECEAFAWDLETNTKAVRQFSVRHKRDVGGGSKDVKTERDIYNIIASNAQRRVRSAILEIIPGDIIEDAVEQCVKTQQVKVGDVAEAASKLVQAFAEIGVSREAIEKRLGQRIDSVRPAQIIAFRKIYTSIKDGMSEPKDWFDISVTPPPDPQPEQPAAPAKSNGKAAKTNPTAAQPAPVVEPAPAPEPEQEMKPGPDQSEPLHPIYCPNREKKIEEDLCDGCASRYDCLSWDMG